MELGPTQSLEPRRSFVMDALPKLNFEKLGYTLTNSKRGSTNATTHGAENVKKTTASVLLMELAI